MRFQSLLLLHGAQLHPDDQLRLGGHVLEDVSLQPPQHVRPQEVVKLLDLVLLGDVGKLLQEALKVTKESSDPVSEQTRMLGLGKREEASLYLKRLGVRKLSR